MIGKTIRHPDGRKVKIKSGHKWINGRLSNFWYWNEVLPNGELARKTECGYGWW